MSGLRSVKHTTFLTKTFSPEVMNNLVDFALYLQESVERAHRSDFSKIDSAKALLWIA